VLITSELLRQYGEYCLQAGQAEETVKVKLRNLAIFMEFCGDEEPSQELIARFRSYVIDRYNTPTSRNNMLCKVKVFLRFIGRSDLATSGVKVDRYKKSLKTDERLTSEDLSLMLEHLASRGEELMSLILLLLATAGVRSGELQYITVEAAENKEVTFEHHGKPRRVILPEDLCRKLKAYADERNITSGAIIITRHGNPVNQRTLSTQLKRLAERVGIPREKMSATALRVLFAELYYEKFGDLPGLTDLLGLKDESSTALYVS
jgi:site-specific recombinase XerD